MTGSRKRYLVVIVAILVCLSAIGFVFSDSILYELGALLVNAGPPQKADAVVVIGGDLKGNRIVTGARLVQEGYAPYVIASGSGGMYGALESELEVNYAVSRGYPRDKFVSLQVPVLNTAEEARLVIGKLRELGIHKYLLVTSDYHTARAGRIFRKEGRDLEEHTIAAAEPYWNNGAGGRAAKAVNSGFWKR